MGLWADTGSRNLLLVLGAATLAAGVCPFIVPLVEALGVRKSRMRTMKTVAGKLSAYAALDSDSKSGGGALYRCRVLDLHPTQMCIGEFQVQVKIGRLSVTKDVLNRPKRLVAYMAKAPLEVVIGPKGVPYIVDRHHHAKILYHLGQEEALCTLRTNWAHMEEEEFWDAMVKAKYIWNYDENGNQVDWSEMRARLPQSLLELKDDPYRSIAGLLEDVGAYNKAKANLSNTGNGKSDDTYLFLDFKWANHLRKYVQVNAGSPLDVHTFSQIYNQAMQVTQSSELSKGMPGFVGGAHA